MPTSATSTAVTPAAATPGAARSSLFATLAQVAQAVTSTLEPSQVLDRIVGAALDLLPNSAARIWVVEDTWLRLRAEAGTRGPDRAGRNTQVAFGEGLSGHVALTHEPLVVEDIAADGRATNMEWTRAQGCVSCVG